jgi:MFS family permease
MPRIIVLNGFVGFIFIAALVAMFGPSFPSLQNRFAISESEVGLSLTAHFIGTFSGTLAAAFFRRMTLRLRLITCSLIFVLGSFVIALAPLWWIFLAGTAFRGFGAGIYFVEMNTLFATGFGKRSAALLSLVNAAYGAGSLVGPLIIGLASGDYRLPFLVGSFLSLILLVMALLSPKMEVSQQRTDAGTGAPYGLVALFVVMLFCSGSMENGLGAWMTTQFVAQGISIQVAANYTGMYWAGLTVGRILMTPLAFYLSPFQLLIAGFSFEALLLILAHIQGFTVPAYILAGLSVAPLFTSGLAWMARALPGFSLATVFGLAGSSMGAALFSPILGKFIEWSSPMILPTVVLGVTLIGLAVAIVIYFVSKKPM